MCAPACADLCEDSLRVFGVGAKLGSVRTGGAVAKGGLSMNVREVREVAKGLKIKNYTRLTREELIRAIQCAEGNADCFGKIEECGQADCCWREGCQ